MSYDHWKTTNPADDELGPEPPPCWNALRVSASNRCVDCDAPPGQCWWGGEVIKFEDQDDE